MASAVPPQPKPEYLLVIDFETTGTDPKVNQAIEVGALIVRKDTLELVDDYYSQIQFDASQFKWTYGAQAVHGYKKKSMEQTSKTMNQVGNEIGELLFKYFGGKKVTVCGHNPGFDRSFLEQVLQSAGIEVEFGFRMVDTYSIGQALWNAKNSDELFELVGVKRKEHNAWQDADACLQVLRKARSLVPVEIKVKVN